MINRLLIVGVGLIGGSVALALRRAGFVGSIIGLGRSQKNLITARNLGIIDGIALNLSSAVESADVVLLAVPVGSIRNILGTLKPFMNDKTVVTDVGSVKGKIVTDAREVLGECFSRFVPGHPVAGSEERGSESAYADLFVNHHVLLTPTQATDTDAVGIVKAMWEATGALVSLLDDETHDSMLAITSHLPHVLAYSLMGLIASKGGARSFKGFMAGGFRDTTRIASSDSEIWTDILLNNQKEVLSACLHYKEQLIEFVDALDKKDSERLRKLIESAKKTRDDCILPDANYHED